MEWREISGSWVLVPPQPIAVVHFLGELLSVRLQCGLSLAINGTRQSWLCGGGHPFVNTFDHQAIARSVLNRFEIILERLQKQGDIPSGLLPVYGLGHSLGCKLHLLIGSLYEVERAGNILVAFNNYPVKQAIPFGEQLAQLQLDKFLTGLQKQLRQFNLQLDLNFEFTPSPEETNLLIAENYRVRRNLLIKFSNDDIDQTLGLRPILNQQTSDLVAYCPLPGNHLTPLGQDIQWETAKNFPP
ncbi:DUF1350 family protein [Synechocystis sp. B12]|nr:DUF1350 family protein [Synechocystis sp. B12]